MMIRSPICAPIAVPIVPIVLIALVGVLAFTSVPARASSVRGEIGPFGPGGPASGGFANPTSIADEQSSGDVYVYEVGENAATEEEEGRIYRFNAIGEPVDFSSTPTSNVIKTGVGGFTEGESEIAVDSASGLDQGDIYVATGEKVLIYNSEGIELAPLTEAEEPVGVAVDPSGDVYVAFSKEDAVKKYIPVTATTYNNVSSLSQVTDIGNIAADSAGDIYAASDQGPGGVAKYEASQFNTEGKAAVGTTIDSAGTTLAVSGDVYIDERSDVAVYTSSGERVEEFGSGFLGSSSFGVAVSDASGHSGDVYVSGGEASEALIFGPAPIAGDDTLTITKTGTGSGTVECEASGSGHFEACATEYGEGTAITLEGTAGSGSTFEGWSGGAGSAASCAGDGPCTFTINAATKVTATFNATSGGGKGEKGERGPKGEKGEAGINGTNGGRGPQGPAGEAGPAGPQGERGSAGANGVQGPAGARGPAGPAGKVELVTCETVKRKGKSAQRCTTKLVSGAVKLTSAGASAHALLSRHGAVYATGTARSAHGHTSLRLTPLRKLRPGHYTLTLIGGAGRYETIRREAFMLR